MMEKTRFVALKARQSNSVLCSPFQTITGHKHELSMLAWKAIQGCLFAKVGLVPTQSSPPLRRLQRLPNRDTPGAPAPVLKTMVGPTQ